MDKQTRIQAFSELGNQLNGFLSKTSPNLPLDKAIKEAAFVNPWFTEENCKAAIKSIVPWLNVTNLCEWTNKYKCPDNKLDIGVVMAGNIPLVGFHDFLSTLVCGHRIFARLSSKDRHLLPAIASMLFEIEPGFSNLIHFVVELPKKVEAVIATGSDNTSRYFDYYFKEKPRIIRANRSSVAVLTGNESDEEIAGLASDVCMYFGLGCRNVSKVYIPDKALLERLSVVFQDFNWMLQQRFYADNITYQTARLNMLGIPYIMEGPVILKEEKSITSPIGVLNYELYDDVEMVQSNLDSESEKIQCIVGKNHKDFVNFGKTQMPDLYEYADNIDTLGFLTTIGK